ncbi:hypothetical protein HUN08_09365 [Gordonia sp. X0973]|uniref:hypothetical protein n=1 Tax=Gordonia sp. X0973 TaxID=2742602 RepID=UPI000F546F51|nr:hypothetical protein [Gordonia sp. X0973]QKT07377.1 hypothetical protein HUN08_09365 [Gordonia sp. X0973]
MASNVFDDERIAGVLFTQDGVITRQQALNCGLTEGEVRRKLHRREWVRMSSGVYLTHTGTASWRQWAWVAVLAVPGAVLSHESVLCLMGIRPPAGAIHVAIDRKAFAPRLSGVRVHRYAQLDERVARHRNPPHVRIEHAALDVAAAAESEMGAIAVLAEVVRERTTTPARIREAMASRERCRRRAFLDGLLGDIAGGTCSVLEHRYLADVERPHGLPKGRRQAPTTVGRHGFRDVLYEEAGLIIELDGRFGHDDARSRDADLERDLDAAVYASLQSQRIGWGQVVERPCVTAEKIAQLLTDLGWKGVFKPCPKCTVPRSTAA